MASKTKVAMSSPVDRIAALTDERDRLREQADLVRAAPRSQTEAIGDIPKVVSQLAERFTPPTWFLANGPAGYGDLAHSLGTHSPEYQPVTAAATLAWVAPDLLRAAIERDLERHYEGLPTPMSSVDKATELGRIETEIAAAWWHATDSGMTLPVPDVGGATLIGLSAP